MAAAFRDNFSERNDLGAAVCVYVDGEPAVDLWGGYADPGRERVWQEDTLAVAFSSTKGITATCVHRLVEAGKLDLEMPVAHYWPEFAARGKEHIPVSWVLVRPTSRISFVISPGAPSSSGRLTRTTSSNVFSSSGSIMSMWLYRKNSSS